MHWHQEWRLPLGAGQTSTLDSCLVSSARCRKYSLSIRTFYKFSLNICTHYLSLENSMEYSLLQQGCRTVML